MRRIRIIGLVLVAVLAISAVAVSAASAAKLTLSEGGAALAPGDTLYAYAPPGDFSITAERPNGSLGCEFFQEAELGARVVTNSKYKDALEIRSVRGVEDGACETYAGWAEVALDGVNALELRPNGSATTGEASLSIEFEVSRATCDYSTSHLTGSNTATTNRQKLEIELGGILKLDSARGSLGREDCPKKTYFEISFPTVEGEHDELIEEQT
jgi:hypothetical protein